MPPSALGYVPQFSIAHDALTVEECVATAARLRTSERDEALDLLVDRVMADVGLAALGDRRVGVLSGGQRRRLGLALELVSQPELLLCDEVTSGLDPKSEREIVELLHQLAGRDRRSIVHVTHSFAHLDLYDSIVVLHEGRITYHGPPRRMAHYFSVATPEDVYTQLASRPGAEWAQSWLKHREPYALPLEKESDISAARADDLPGVVGQFLILLRRRVTLWWRDRGQWRLQLAMLLGFPLLVIVFALHGLDPMPDRSLPVDLPLADALLHQSAVVASQAKLGATISGLVMFQVILLTLMGANNASREIAGERLLYEKERLAGLSPLAYVMSKVVFLSILVLVQSTWMAWFVDHFVGLPGDMGARWLLLTMANAAMTSVCLGLSAWARTAEQASLLSVYLVGFQLPLAGAVLALPKFIEPLLQPLITAYWSWTGQLAAMRPSDYFVGIIQAVPTPVADDASRCVAVLAIHVVVGMLAAWLGCQRRRWDDG
jgi:ABC transport system ATP-binding/permease protein